jgi:hypothetical protein
VDRQGKGQQFRKLTGLPDRLTLWGQEALLVDGDIHDARPLDPPGTGGWDQPVAVGLRWKIPIGNEAHRQLAQAQTLGFVTPAFLLPDSSLQLRGMRQNPGMQLVVAPVTPRFSLDEDPSTLAG